MEESGTISRLDSDSTKQRFVLLFANFGGNLGDSFILDRTITWLCQRFPRCQIRVSPLAHRGHEELQNNLCQRFSNVTILPSFTPRGWQWASWLPMRYQRWRTAARSSDLAIELRHADAVLGLGGGHWGGVERSLNMLALCEVATKCCKRVVLMPQSLPASVAPEVLRRMNRGLASAELLIRDPESLKTAQAIGLRWARLTPDSAFLADPLSNSKSSPRTPPHVAVCLRTNTARQEASWDSFARVFKMLREHGCRLQTFTTHARRDAEMVSRCASVDGVERLSINTVDDVFAAVLSADVVISDRLHVLIFATLVGTPILPVMSVQKVVGYAEYLQYPVRAAAFPEISWDNHLEPIMSAWHMHRQMLLEFAKQSRQNLTRTLEQLLDCSTRAQFFASPKTKKGVLTCR